MDLPGIAGESAQIAELRDSLRQTLEKENGYVNAHYSDAHQKMAAVIQELKGLSPHLGNEPPSAAIDRFRKTIDHRYLQLQAQAGEVATGAAQTALDLLKKQGKTPPAA